MRKERVLITIARIILNAKDQTTRGDTNVNAAKSFVVIIVRGESDSKIQVVARRVAQQRLEVRYQIRVIQIPVKIMGVVLK